MLKLTAAAFAALFLTTACTQTGGTSGPTTAASNAAGYNGSGMARLSVVTAKQTPAVDRMVRGLSAGQYFPGLRSAVQEGKSGFQGADGIALLAIRNGNTIHWRQECTLDGKGACEVDVPVSSLKPNSALCMKTPWPIAHQRVKPDFNDNRNWVCADGLYDYYVLGRRSGKFVVAAIKEAS